MFNILLNFSFIKFAIGIIIGTLLVSCSSINKNMKIQNIADSLILSKHINKLNSSHKQLILKADKLLNKKFKTVIDKKIIASSGDRQDYLSRAIYY